MRILKKVLRYLLLGLFFFILVISILGGGYGTIPNQVEKRDPIIFAHRGIYTDEIVENSHEAFAKAKSAGYSAIETDVNITSDDKFIIFHDSETKRLLNIDNRINELSWEYLKGVYLHHNGKKTISQVLSLQEFLKLQDGSCTVYLDMKRLSFSIAKRLLSLISDIGNTDSLIIADSNLLYLCYIKLMNPDIKVALEGFTKGKEWIYHIIPKNFKPDYLASHLRDVDRDHMSFIADNNLLHRKIVYGVNNTNLNTVFDLGLYNIIYDHDPNGISASQIQSKINTHFFYRSQ